MNDRCNAILELAGMKLLPIGFKPHIPPKIYAEAVFYDGSPAGDFQTGIHELAYKVCSKKWPVGTTFMNPKLSFQFTLNGYEICVMFTIDVIERSKAVENMIAFVFFSKKELPEDVAREVWNYITI
jgi:hypothetical protein